MDTRKLYCDPCNIEISSYNFNKHLKTKKHLENNELSELREWGKENHIYNYELLTK